MLGKKRGTIKKSGSGAEGSSKGIWPYYQQMTFLDDHLKDYRYVYLSLLRQN